MSSSSEPEDDGGDALLSNKADLPDGTSAFYGLLDKM